VLGERPTPRRVLALALAFSGLVVLVLGQGVSAGVEKLPGVAFALSAAVLFSLGTVITKRWPLGLAPLPTTAWQVGIGCAPLGLLSPLLETPAFEALTPVGWAALVYMAVGPLCLCYIAWFAALKRLPASVATVGTLLAPVVGVLSAAAVLGEPLGPRELSALALTILGILLAVRG
jgi:drug/metabolite transporter (DMT)-like permease